MSCLHIIRPLKASAPLFVVVLGVVVAGPILLCASQRWHQQPPVVLTAPTHGGMARLSEPDWRG